VSEITTLQVLTRAGVQMQAMILLGLNGGFGCTDCAELRWKNLDLEQGRVDLLCQTRQPVGQVRQWWQGSR